MLRISLIRLRVEFLVKRIRVDFEMVDTDLSKPNDSGKPNEQGRDLRGMC